MNGKLVLKTAGSEPVTLAQLKAQCRLTDDETLEDDLLASYGATARQAAEDYLGRALSTQEYYLYFDDCFPHEIGIPMPPLQSVSEITYVDVNGETQILAASEYLVDNAAEPARIVPAYNKYWPATRYQKNAVRVEFVCGYSAADESPEVTPLLPQPIANCILMAAGWLFVNRELAEIPEKSFWAIDPYRMRRM